MSKANKLAVVLVAFLLVIEANMEDILRLLEKILCIHYLLHFKKDLYEIRALINLSSEVNTITPAYATKLGLKIRKTNIKIQKIDNSTFNIFEMVLTNFQIKDKLGKA